MQRRGDSWTAYGLWCLAGAGLSFGVLSILTVGAFVLLLTLGLCGWLLWRLDFGWGMLGLLAGAAVPLLYVAWLNRDGPGTVCTVTATETTCSDQWSPWPFVAVAVVLVVAGLVAFVRFRRG